MDPIHVVSLFDGMSCGQLALARAKIPVAKYYASEIDKHAMIVTKANFPETDFIGDVRDIDPAIFPKINLLIGGSPCQSFSFAGKRKGMSAKSEDQENELIEILTLEHYLQLKKEGFEFEGQSYLFWEYIRILTELRKKNPDIKFLLENVMMGEKWQRILTRAIGINPIEINASLVSAQNRERLYWTNIHSEPQGFFGDLKCMIPQPKDRGIYLRDILEKEVDQKYYLSEVAIARILRKKGFLPKIDPVKGGPLNTKNNSGQVSFDSGTTLISDRGSNGQFVFSNSGKVGALSSRDGCSHDHSVMFYTDIEDDAIAETKRKARCLQVGGHGAGNHSDVEIITVHNNMPRTGGKKKGGTGHLSRTDGKTYGLNTESKLNILEIGKREVIQLNESTESQGRQPYQQKRIYDEDGIAPALCQEKADLIVLTGESGIRKIILRRLIPMECERLQCVPDNYTTHVSDTQRYRMLGNGWNIDVIEWIFSFFKL